MTNEPTTPTNVEDAAVPADEEPVEPEAQEELPDHLDLPLEVPEADAIEQELEVPIDDDER